MRIRCPKHGVEAVVCCSKDLWSEDRGGRTPDEIVDIVFEYAGFVASSSHVSRTFAQDHRLSAGVFPLPDDYPEWQRELSYCCMKCFQESHRGHFDRNSRWHFDERSS